MRRRIRLPNASRAGADQPQAQHFPRPKEDHRAQAKARLRIPSLHRYHRALLEWQEALHPDRHRPTQKEAVDAINKALQVRTREQLPHEWATTQNNLGTAFFVLAGRSEGEQKTSYLDQALYSFTNALYVSNEVNFPTQWAQTMHNLADVYVLKGEWISARDVYQSLVYHDSENQDWRIMLQLLTMIVDPSPAR